MSAPPLQIESSVPEEATQQGKVPGQESNGECSGLYTGFLVWGGDSTPRGVWGHVPPGKCQIMSILNGFWGGDIPVLPPLYESLVFLGALNPFSLRRISS